MAKKFFLAFALAVAILSVIFSAEASYGPQPGVVVNCNEWISLREYPSTSARRLLKIPLGATVLVSGGDVDYGDFYYVQYQGVWGYALKYYVSVDWSIYRGQR